MYSSIKIFITGVVLIFSGSVSYSAELVKISFVTDSIIVLQFSEGYVDHYGAGQEGQDDIVHKDPLDLTVAAATDTYMLLSNEDPDYRKGVSPYKTGRKSKGSDFSSIWPPIQPYISDHWIYLVFPYPLKDNHFYRLSIGQLAKNSDPDILIYVDYKSGYSETIHVNNIGFVPEAGKKFAYLSNWMGSLKGVSLDKYRNRKFHLVNLEDFTTVYSGNITLRKDYETGDPDTGQEAETPNGNYTGADVWQCDFSDYSTAGQYILFVEGMGCSNPFRIDKDVYREAFYVTARGLYHHRCGIALEEPYTRWTKAQCHHPDVGHQVILSDWRYMDGRNAFEELPKYSTSEQVDYWGGWHDAGDWDKHHRHLSASQALLMVYEFAPNNFEDGELNIPESNNGIPDIIDEAKWTIDLYKRMQEPDGGIHGGLETTRHPASGTSSDKDTDQWYAYAKDPQASFNYAASAAQLAFCLQLIGKDITAQEYALSAEKAWNWGINNTQSEEEALIRDYRHHAAAWLYKLTGLNHYQEQFKADNLINKATDRLYRYGELDQQKGTWAYVTTDQPGIDTSLKSLLYDATLNWASENNVETAKKRSGRMGHEWWIPTLVGAATTPKNLPLIAAYHISRNHEFLDYQYTTCDYFLGGNPLNMTWITGLGDRHPKEVMHLDSWFIHEGKEMVPGIVPYGPHHYGTGDFNGPWDYLFGLNTTYPDASEWPVHELWFENRYCPITNEYTVRQTIGPASAAYGFLCSNQSRNLNPNVKISTPGSYSKVLSGKNIMVEFIADDRDGNINRLALYNGAELLTDIDAANRSVTINNPDNGNYLLNIRAWDNEGGSAISAPVNIIVGENTITGLKRNPGHEIIIHPNPSGDLINVVSLQESIVKMDLLDQAGRIIHAPGDDFKTISIDKLKPGIYYLRISLYSGKVITKKVFKK